MNERDCPQLSRQGTLPLVPRAGVVRGWRRVLLAAILAVAGCSTPPADLRVTVLPAAELEPAHVSLEGLSSRELSALRSAGWTDPEWQQFLRLTVDGGADVAVVGSYEVTDGGVRFIPSFPLDPGRAYVARVDPARLPTPRFGAPLSQALSLPRAPEAPPVRVTGIHPGSSTWPSNLLRFYVDFSGPMSREPSTGRVRVMDADGREVVDALLPADVDLWNDDRTRYTALFDPGRVKRGILPNRRMGRPLIPGRRYSIVVDADWTDAWRRPLEASFEHSFVAGPAIEEALDMHRWQITGARAGTRDPVIVVFPHALDHALLQRALGVGRRGQGGIAGEITINAEQREWRFAPLEPWTAGDYDLIALDILEDPSGNRVGRAFEVLPASQGHARSPEPAGEHRRPFAIR